MSEARLERTRRAYTNDYDIVQQLRNWEGEYHYPSGLLYQAATEIEGLRITVRNLKEKIQDLEKGAARKSWEGHVDRMSGALDAEEKDGSYREMGS